MDNREKNIRNSDKCLGCDNNKVIGTVVCWNCFKYRKDITPLKYFGGDVFEWLKVINHK